MKILQQLAFVYGRTIVGRETSYYGITPGNIISLNYQDDIGPRLGLVVSSERTTSGRFISTRNNTLLNVFLLGDLTLSMLNIIVNNLYNNKTRCSYRGVTGVLKALFPTSSFRTFNIAKARDFIKYNIS